MEGVVIDEWVRTNDAADQIGVTYMSLYRWVKAGVIPARSMARVQGGRTHGPGSCIAIRQRDIPKCRLLAAVQRAFGATPGAGLTLDQMAMIADHYRDGRIDFDGFALTWEVEDD